MKLILIPDPPGWLVARVRVGMRRYRKIDASAWARAFWVYSQKGIEELERERGGR